MKKILCLLGFHDLDWSKCMVVDFYGNSLVPCRRCNTMDLCSSEVTQKSIARESTKKALKDIWQKHISNLSKHK